MPHRYEILRRGSDEHRAGHFTLHIDGVESELTVDPGQFMPKSLRQATEEGLTGDNLALRVNEICEMYARRALQRRVNALERGSLIPGGIPFSIGKGLDTRRIAPRKRRTEKEAVESFLNRGSLRGLTADERKARRERRNQRRDEYPEWLERRKALADARRSELKELEAKMAKLVEETKGTGAESAAVLSLSDRIQVLKEEIEALEAPVMAASHGFQYAYVQYLTKQVDLTNDDIRIWPLMTNTTVDTERDAKDQFSDFTTIDEFDGANYSSGGLALDSQATAVDDANDRAEFDAADEAVTALGAGTRSIQGVCLGKFVTNTAASMPLHWIEFASAKTPDGSDFTFVFNAEGILQAADG